MSLRVVLLGWNGFHLPGCKVLMRALQHNTTLVELDLTANRLDMTCLQYLLKGLAKNEHLSVLKVGNHKHIGAAFNRQNVSER